MQLKTFQTPLTLLAPPVSIFVHESNRWLMIDVGKHDGVNRAGKQSKDGHTNSKIARIEYYRLEQRDTNNYPDNVTFFFALT